MTDLKLDLKGAMREAFGKCPKCNQRLRAGNWLKWCDQRGCRWWGLK